MPPSHRCPPRWCRRPSRWRSALGRSRGARRTRHRIRRCRRLRNRGRRVALAGYAESLRLLEGDGDTHGWLKVDPPFASLINAGNTSDEGGNLVFEIVCHYQVTQADAKPTCGAFTDHTTIPPVGAHVAITGTLVREKNHKQWNEIHPGSRIEQRQRSKRQGAP